MKEYDNGYRYIALFGETDEQKQELNNILDEKGYDYEENESAVHVLANEIVGINKNLKNFMTRIETEEDKLATEVYLKDLCTEMIENTLVNISLPVEMFADINRNNEIFTGIKDAMNKGI